MLKFNCKLNITKKHIFIIGVIVFLILALIVTYKLLSSQNAENTSFNQQDIYLEKINNQPFTKKPNIDFSKLPTQDE
ncbi:MAG: hypothetical protein ACOZBL_02570 [Patescibacteria group bacterium]